MSEGRRAITEIEAAAFLGLSVATLRQWRHKRKGPQFFKAGRAVRYFSSDLDAYVRHHMVPTNGAGGDENGGQD